MTVIAQAGLFAFAEQLNSVPSGSAGQKGAYYANSGSVGCDQSMFMLHKAMDLDIGPQQDQRTFPLEVGGIIVPTGAYKGMAFGGGGATVNPRLEGSFGKLVKGAFGSSGSTSGPIYSDNIVTKGYSGANAKGMVAVPTGGAATYSCGAIEVPAVAHRLVLKAVFDNVMFAASGSASGYNVTISDMAAGTPHTESFNLVTAWLDSDVDPANGSGVVFLGGDAVNLASGTGWTITMPDLSGEADDDVPANSIFVSVGFIYDAVESVAKHTFTMDKDDSMTSPWYQIREVIPHTTPGQELGFDIRDCRLSALRINFPQNGLVTARVDFVGREPLIVANPFDYSLDASPNWKGLGTSGSPWESAEDYNSVPVSCVLEGGITVPGGNLISSSTGSVEMSFTNLSVTYANNMTTPQQEMIIGQYFPEDFVPLSRAVTYSGTVKWKDSYLYQRLMKFRTSGQTWSPIVWTSPFYAKAASPNNMSNLLTSQWHAQMYSKRVIWSIDRTPVLAGGEIVTMQITGTAIDNGGTYSKFVLTNARTLPY